MSAPHVKAYTSEIDRLLSKPRKYRGRAGACSGFSSLRLAASPLHAVQFGRDKLNTVVSAVTSFIESFNKACSNRNKLVKRLGRSLVAKTIKRALKRCKPNRRCGCIWCPICARIYRAWVVSQVLALAQLGVPATIVVLNLREVAAEALKEVDRGKTLDLLRKHLEECGFQAVIGNLEVAYKPERKTWCIHVHLVVFGDVTGPVAALRAMYRARGVRRAVHAEPVSSPLRQFSYQFKFVTYYRFRSHRDPYPLARAQLEQLIEWTPNVKFTDFLILIGFQRRGSIVASRSFRRLVAKLPGDVATWRRAKGGARTKE